MYRLTPKRTIGKASQKGERRPKALPGDGRRFSLGFSPQVLCSFTKGGAELKEEKY